MNSKTSKQQAPEPSPRTGSPGAPGKALVNRILLDSLPCQATLMRADGTIILSNKAALDAGAVPGTRCHEAWAKRDEPCPWCLAPAALESGTSRRLETENDGVCWDIHWVPIGPDLVIRYAFDISTRKRAEEELRRAKEYSERLIESANVMIVGLDAGGRITTFNQAAEQITGYAKNEVAGRKWYELLVPRERYPLVWEKFHAWISSSLPMKISVNPIMTKDREERDISWQNSEIREGDETVGTVSFGIDVTDHKRAVSRLHAANRMLKMLSACNGALVRAADEVGLIREICRNIVTIGVYQLAWVGFAEEDPGKSVRSGGRWGYGDEYVDAAAITWADETRGRGPVGRAIRTGTVQLVRDVRTDPDFEPWREAAMSRGYASLIALPLLSEGRAFGSLNIYAGDPDAFDTDTVRLLHELADNLSYGIQALRGRTRRKKAEEALKESEERFRTLVEHSLVGFFIVQEGKIVFMNPEQERIFGSYSRNRAVEDFACIHLEDRERFERLCAGEAGDASPDTGVDVRLLFAEAGEERTSTKWMHGRSAPIRYQGGKAILVNMIDVTQVKELERIALAQEKMASLGHVAAGIAHEIRNPLSGLNIYLDSLVKILEESENLDAETRDMAKTIAGLMEAASSRIETVIRRVMDFSRPAPLRLVPAAVNPAIDEAVCLSALMLSKGGIRIRKSLCPDLPPSLLNPRLIEQVLLNLITNAAQAMEGQETPKEIEISSSLEGGRVAVRVADSGPGVSPHLREKVFDPFFTTKNEGTGIGLSFSRKVIADHGGFIEIGTSRFGGAEFRIELPAAPEGAPAQPPPDTADDES